MDIQCVGKRCDRAGAKIGRYEGGGGDTDVVK